MRILKLMYSICFKFLISATLIFSPVAYSEESSGSSGGGEKTGAGNSGSSGGGDSNASGGESGGSSGGGDSNASGGESSGSSGGGEKTGGNSGKGNVQLPGSNAGRIDRIGDKSWSINFSKSANPGKGEGGSGGGSGKGDGKGDGNGYAGDNIGSRDGSSNNSVDIKKAQSQERSAYKSYIKKQLQNIEKEIQEEIQKLKTNLFYSFEEKTSKITAIIQGIEPRIRSIVQNPNMKLSYPKNTKQAVTEADIQIMIQAQEMPAYYQADSLMRQSFSASRKYLENNIQALHQSVDIFTSPTEQIDLHSFQMEESPDLYEQNITQSVHEILKSKYDRRELGLTGDQELSQPNTEPYEFISPEGSFLDKNKNLYNKLRESNPFHEQGVIAKDIGISAVETADQEFAEGNDIEAETAFQIGEAMADIALGLTPYVGVGKDAYELLTGKHLLTGRTLSLFERSMTVVGLVLSGVSGGMLSSGSLKFSLQKTGQVLGKINSKLLDKTSQGLSELQLDTILKKYPETFFNSVESIGLATKKGVQSAQRFVIRAFARETPTLDQLTGTIQAVGKEGINTYTEVLKELKNLNQFGEEFLARKLKFKSEILNKTKQIVDRTHLIEMGRLYSQKYKLFNGITKSVFTGRVWRGANKKYITNSEDLFKFHKGMDSRISRYNIGQKALYTSLKEETAIKELMEKTDLTLNQLKNTYIIGQSKNININQVLDLTDPKVIKQLDISTDKLIKNIQKNTNAYDLTQVIGHIARSKNFKGIITHSAPDISNAGKNFISFKEF